MANEERTEATTENVADTATRTEVVDMTKGPILGPLVRFAIPLMISTALQMAFTAADMAVLGQFANSQAVAAVGATDSLLFLIVELFAGMSVGATVVISNSLGAHERDLRSQVQTALALALCFGLVTMAIGLLGSPTFLVWMQTPADVLDQAILYLRIYFVGQPAAMVYWFGRAIIVPTGDTRRPLYYLAAAGVLNVALNLFFVLGFGMDVAGVAIGTAASQLLGAFLVVRRLMALEGPVRLDLSRISVDSSSARRILVVGVPAGIQTVLFNISNVIVQSSVNQLGTAYVAGSAASMTVEGFAYIGMEAISQGGMAFVGQCYGARDYARIRKVCRMVIVLTLITGFSFAAVVVMARLQLLGLFLTDSAEAMVVASWRVTLFTLTFPVCGIMDAVSNVLRGMKRSIFPLVATIAGSVVFRIAWVLTVFPWAFANTTHPEAYKLLMVSYPVTWALIALAVSAYYFVLMRRLESGRTH